MSTDFMPDNETNSQRKKRLAREFNERKITEEKDREARIAERKAYEATPEGIEKARLSRRKMQQILMISAAMSLSGSGR